jgi:hypothetical protein
MENNSIFFQCRVLNTEDPMMLGRIRGIRLIDNYDDILKSVSDPPWNEEFKILFQAQPQPLTNFISVEINSQVQVCKSKTLSH